MQPISISEPEVSCVNIPDPDYNLGKTQATFTELGARLEVSHFRTPASANACISENLTGMSGLAKPEHWSSD